MAKKETNPVAETPKKTRKRRVVKYRLDCQWETESPWMELATLDSEQDAVTVARLYAKFHENHSKETQYSVVKVITGENRLPVEV